MYLAAKPESARNHQLVKAFTDSGILVLFHILRGGLQHQDSGRCHNHGRSRRRSGDAARNSFVDALEIDFF